MNIDGYEVLIASSVGQRDGLAVEINRISDGELMAEIFRDDLNDTVVITARGPIPLGVARVALRNAADRL